MVGGAHVNAVGRQALEEGPFDYACVGEGEFLVRELAEALERSIDTSAILGLVSRKSGEIVTLRLARLLRTTTRFRSRRGTCSARRRRSP